MSPFSWQCHNLCLLSLAFIIDWRVVTSSQVSNPSLSETLCFSVWECRAKCAYSVWCVRIGRRPLHATVFKGRFCTSCTGAVSHPSHKGPFPLFSNTPRGAFLCKSFMWGSQCISNIKSIENLPPLCVCKLDLCQPMPSSTNSKNTCYVYATCVTKNLHFQTVLFLLPG